MSLDIARAKIAVISNQTYRAQAIALAVEKMSGGDAQAFTKPDVALAGFETVLLDVGASLDSSLDRVREITGRHPNIKVVLLGVVESEETVVRLAEAGASGYAGPATNLRDLVAIVQSVHKGEFKCPPHITYALFSHLTYLADGRSPQPPKSPVLTMRERRIVELLAHNFTNKEIAARLCISQSTAKNHVQRILKKLGLHDRCQASRSPVFRWPIALPQTVTTDSLFSEIPKRREGSL
jgi:DNA-binding NarL/FixJ family response regulator